MLRQRYGSLAAARDGLIVVAVVGGRVQYVSSSLAQDTALTNAVKLDADAAVRAAAANAGLSPSDRYGQPKLVAIPTPERGVRRVWMVQLYRPGTDPQGFASYVDAETGRSSCATRWSTTRPTTRRGRSSRARRRSTTRTTDSRVQWCWTAPRRLRPRRRQRGVAGPVGRRLAYQRVHVHDPRQQRDRGPQLDQQRPAHRRHRARDVAAEPRLRVPVDEPVAPDSAATRPTFTSPQRNDIDAARANLFAMHNRMHDFVVPPRLHRGDLEPAGVQLRRAAASADDPEQGNAQAGGIVGGPPSFAAPRQRQPDHAAGRHHADHQHVPVAADRRRVLRARASTATTTCR